MTLPNVSIISTGCANMASVVAGLRRAGARPTITDDPQVVLDAPHVVLPGVGAFGPAMNRLRDRALDFAVARRVEQGGPLLAICLGLQLLCRRSEESPGVEGIGVIDADIVRFPAGCRVPQMGWNRVDPASASGPLRPAVMYFANSYHADRVPDGWSAAFTSHGRSFASAFSRRGVLACQFHPELSGSAGQSLVRRWLGLEQEGGGPPC